MASNSVIHDANNQTLKSIEDENIAKQLDMLQNLYVIWKKVGVDNEQKLNRAHQVWGYVFDILKDIIVEETVLYEDIQKRVINYEKNISKLLAELGLPTGDEVVGTLIIREEALRHQLDELSKMKHERTKKFQELLSLELKYCKVLGMRSLDLSSSTGVPTEKDIYELQQHVNMLAEEKDHRQKKFYRLKEELTTILEVTEFTPETPLEKEILNSKEDNLSLSNETFKLLEQIVTKTKSKRADLENEKAILMDKLSLLWDILKIDKEEREKFLSKYTCCRVSSLNAIKEEISRCEGIKRKNIKKYLEALKEELSSLFEKCFISNSEAIFSHFCTDEVNEAILDIYDNEVTKWKKYYTETEHIIRNIQKRHKLWDLVTVFENKANNPDRFKNRRGKLLEEERERKKLQKNLHALDNEIFLAIEKYEKDTGKQFLYYGENFRVYVSNQRDDKLALTKQRSKLRTKQLEDKQTLGLSPAKRPFITPKSGPSKLLLTPAKGPFITPKSEPNKLIKSGGVKIYRTPNTARQMLPCTTARMRTTKLSALKFTSNKKVERNVLKEKNVNTTEASNSFESTTYTDFADKLNRSSRNAHRSTVLSSRKIAGTRISINTSKRKSVNTSLKSIRKRGDT